MSDEFYVGYAGGKPPGLAAFSRRVTRLVVAGGLALGVLLLIGMSAFSDAVFEFGVERELEGVVTRGAVPTLEVPRAGGGVSSYLLTGFGKHGASEDVAPFAGRRVRLRGSLIHRDGRTMVEVVSGSLQHLGAAPEPAEEELGACTFAGEIVDSKCFLGVMKPGNLKPHRACAVRCISGGVPPVLLVRDAEGGARYLVLVGSDGAALNDRVLDVVAEPVRVTGRLVRRGTLELLHVDDDGIRRGD